MDHWLKNETNYRFIGELREEFAKHDPQVLIFLGAGLSFGASRLGVRGAFEHCESDDGYRFPIWKQLVHRMKTRLKDVAIAEEDSPSLDRFFAESGPLDCAELFHH